MAIDPALVDSLGGLWRLALVVLGAIVIIVFVVVFRQEIRRLFPRVKKFIFRRGDTQVEFEQDIESPSAQPDAQTAQQEDENDEPESPLDVVGEKAANGSAEPTLFSLMESEDFEAARELFEQQQEEEEDPKERANQEVWYLLLRFMHANDLDSLSRLSEIAAKRAEGSALAYFWLAFAYKRLGEYARAAEASLAAADLSETAQEKMLRRGEAAESLVRAGRGDEAENLLVEEFAKEPAEDIAAILYEALARVYQRMGNMSLRAIALEKAIELNPNKTSLRFDAAYAYASDDDGNPLALLHYTNKLNVDPEDESTLNNLGVVYEQLKLPIKAVENYRQAASLDNTLASANLAYRFMKAGFADEAEEMLTAAKQKPKPHENVSKAIGDLARRHEDEDTRRDERLEEGRKRQTFMRLFAPARIVPAPTAPNIAGEWVRKDGVEVEITQSGADVVADWLDKNKKKRFQGHIRNRALYLDFLDMQYSWYDSSETTYAKKATGLGIAAVDQQSLEVVEIRDEQALFLTMTRK